MADMIRENDCGLAVAPHDSKAFAQGLAFLADHPAEREKMGFNARQLAERKFRRNQLGSRFVSLLESIALKSCIHK
jgi:glycosyltransferase involved in cell wall biosynthesis